MHDTPPNPREMLDTPNCLLDIPESIRGRDHIFGDPLLSHAPDIEVDVIITSIREAEKSLSLTCSGEERSSQTPDIYYIGIYATRVLNPGNPRVDSNSFENAKAF